MCNESYYNLYQIQHTCTVAQNKWINLYITRMPQSVADPQGFRGWAPSSFLTMILCMCFTCLDLLYFMLSWGSMPPDPPSLFFHINKKNATPFPNFQSPPMSIHAYLCSKMFFYTLDTDNVNVMDGQINLNIYKLLKIVNHSLCQILIKKSK